ncbi:hypothetical protein WICPIJ_001481 [Wickerhamomyces pijperi]|uniref:Chromatin-remodeling ATPase INO80 n=1 Tax=Wickerhamomyces pijperi TaxID=599730 RepID=A0A9P8QDN2_WICPI|nr:hypothetical protein WICPIJ_001481 [Wickerhamomyces pijperi]
MATERRKSKRGAVNPESDTRLSISSMLTSPEDEENIQDVAQDQEEAHNEVTDALVATDSVNDSQFQEILEEANQLKNRSEKQEYLNHLKTKLAHITTLDLLNIKAENWEYINNEDFEFLNKSSTEMQEVKKLVKQLSTVELIKKESRKTRLRRVEKELAESNAALKILESRKRAGKRQPTPKNTAAATNTTTTTSTAAAGSTGSTKKRKLEDKASATAIGTTIKFKVGGRASKNVDIAPKKEQQGQEQDHDQDQDSTNSTGTKRKKRAAKSAAGSKIEAAMNSLKMPIIEKVAKGSTPSSSSASGSSSTGSKSNKAGTATTAAPSSSSSTSTTVKLDSKEMRAIKRQYDNVYFTIWKDLSRKDGPKIYRLVQQANSIRMTNMKKTAILCARESKRWQVKTNKTQKDLQAKARRGMREMFSFWKRNEREERDLRKKAEKEALDKAKKEEEERESRRQSRKLNFLITQTELYSHFIGRKIKTDEIEGNVTPGQTNKDSVHDDVEIPANAQRTDVNSLDFDSDNEEEIAKAAAANAQSALLDAKARAKQFDTNKNGELKEISIDDDDLNFQNPTSLGDIAIEQPKLLSCTLKEYQVKGLNWLANLYDQGINGILADEMGLGKTVQSISVLAYLAETHNIWGPFLVVSPASTLHNWQQEISKFVPDFKVLPYWGNSKDRKILRKFWDRKQVTYTKDSPFHVLVTSYQLVVADIQYFQRIKWQYMILDEAQAIKSSSSSRWKSLLSLQCRNRLLLTGTPIQNSMQELWALLHFIMPTLFDSHDEFSEWFSKDIESHAQSNTQLNEQQLRRLHVILKPFMLRRIKKNVQSELGDKIEIDVYCDLTNRQQKLYKMLRSQISLMDLIEKVTSGSDDGNQSLVNLVMQFRKVCNHPDLFERDDVKSPFSFGSFAETGSFLREGSLLEYSYSTKNLIEYQLPKLVYKELLTPTEHTNFGSLNKILNHDLSIWNVENIHNSQQDNEAFTWLRFVDETASSVASKYGKSLIERAIDKRTYTDANIFDDYEDYQDESKTFLLLNRDTAASADIGLTKVKETVYHDMYLNVADYQCGPRASAPPITLTCSSNSFVNDLKSEMFNTKISQGLIPLSLDTQLNLLTNQIPLTEWPKSEMMPAPINNKTGYSSIKMPSMNRFITDSAKLAKLDQLLVELKQNDHRVLVYFQMTKMMDLMEEYLTYRQYKFIRLDGSSKLDDRRDLVHDWQTRPEIFVFLLSTRAGGLGINLTAADTVIFYDSDWNPTIDSQAMDRAHRLGQTRQVTVYRLLVRGTIEERMRDRAKQKEHVQQVVMEGKASDSEKDQAAAASGFQKPSREVAFWLLDDDQAADAISRKQKLDESKELAKAEKKAAAAAGKKKTNSKKQQQKDVNLEDMYHEGEGNFDDGSGNNAAGTGTPVRTGTPLGK